MSKTKKADKVTEPVTPIEPLKKIEPVVWTEPELAQAIAAGVYAEEIVAWQEAGLPVGHLLEHIHLARPGAGKAPEPPAAQSPAKGEPVIVVEPSSEQHQELSALQQARHIAREELRVFQDTLSGLSDSQVVVLADAVVMLKGKIAALLAEVQSLDGQIAALQKSMVPDADTMLDAMASADAQAQATAQATQAEQDEALRVEFKPHRARVESILKAFAGFDKLFRARLQEIAREDEDGFGPETWDAKLRVAYRRRVALTAAELLRVMANLRRELPALLADLDGFLKDGVRPGETWTQAKGELLWRCRHVNSDTMATLDNDSAVILRALSEVLAQAKAHKGPVTPLASLPVPVALQGPNVPKSTPTVGLFDAPDVPIQDKLPSKSVTDWNPFA